STSICHAVPEIVKILFILTGRLASRLLTDSISLFHVVTCSGVLETAQVFSPVPRPAASSHISAGGLQTASGRPAGLANTSQKDLAVLEHGMI
ncbi:TPA: hypothetical protein ACH3X2_009081, partial [Trebouxia sp. C0005]